MFLSLVIQHISMCFRLYFIFWKMAMSTPGVFFHYLFLKRYHNDSLRHICLSEDYYKKQCLTLTLIKPMGFQCKPLAIKNAVYVSRMLLKSKIVLHQ